MIRQRCHSQRRPLRLPNPRSQETKSDYHRHDLDRAEVRNWELPWLLIIPTHADKAAPYSIVEQMIGLIVSSMPSLPAFVRHLRGGAPSTSISFEPLSQRGTKKTSDTSVLWFKRSPKPDHGRRGAAMGLDDPSLLYSGNSGHGDAGYEELTDLGGQKGMQTKRVGLEGFMDNTTLTIAGVEQRVGWVWQCLEFILVSFPLSETCRIWQKHSKRLLSKSCCVSKVWHFWCSAKTEDIPSHFNHTYEYQRVDRAKCGARLVVLYNSRVGSRLIRWSSLFTTTASFKSNPVRTQ